MQFCKSKKIRSFLTNFMEALKLKSEATNIILPFKIIFWGFKLVILTAQHLCYMYLNFSCKTVLINFHDRSNTHTSHHHFEDDVLTQEVTNGIINSDDEAPLPLFKKLVNSCFGFKRYF